MEGNDRSISDGKIYSLQILRGLAFIGIFVSHCKVSALGAWGTSVFFVLSGFLMVYRYYDKELSISPISALRFSYKKIGKLYYLHIITMLADLMMPVFFKGHTLIHLIKVKADKILCNALLVQAWVPSSQYYFSFNAVSWFLSCCLFLYFCFPLILRMIKRLSSIYKAVTCMIIIYIIQIIVAKMLRSIDVSTSISDNFTKWATYICPTFRLGDFSIGGLLGYIYTKQKRCECKEKPGGGMAHVSYGTLFEICALILFLITQMIYANEITISSDWLNRYTCLYLPSSVILINVFSKNQGKIIQALNTKWILHIGNISAFAYLIHQMVIKYIENTYTLLFHETISRFILIILASIITLILSNIYNKTKREIV